MPTPKGSTTWNAGMGSGWTDKRGYRWIYVLENGRRRAKREHRHVMEQHLGRPLWPDELVHHRNEDRTDNRIENLEVLDWSEHTTSHHSGGHRTDLQKRTMEVLANYREDNRRLREINTDLLAALKVAVEHCDAQRGHPKWCSTPWHHDANQAIAKAEGRS